MPSKPPQHDKREDGFTKLYHYHHVSVETNTTGVAFNYISPSTPRTLYLRELSEVIYCDWALGNSRLGSVEHKLETSNHCDQDTICDQL